jgi:hypothetical protein
VRLVAVTRISSSVPSSPVAEFWAFAAEANNNKAAMLTVNIILLLQLRISFPTDVKPPLLINF